MRFKNSRWMIVVGVVMAFLVLGTIVWASPPVSPPSAPLQATPGFDADLLDGHDSAYSGAATNAQRANKFLWASPNGRLSIKSMPLSQLNNRYVFKYVANTIQAATAGPLLKVHNTGSGHGLQIAGAGSYGIDVVSAGASGVNVYSAGQDGVRVNSANWSGVYVNSSGGDAIRVQTAGNDGLRIFNGVGRDYIHAGSNADPDFIVASDGSAYSDGGWKGAADFAELMSSEEEAASYEAGDVLVISTELDRSAALSSEPYSTMVIGIYSDGPGFLGSTHPMEDQRDDEIAVAVVGIVPCKVSVENGPISRGDLLVTSSTPGHAMRADNPAPGTILGKALEPLEEGTGVVSVLVTLQ